jgi:hypothetical protein
LRIKAPNYRRERERERERQRERESERERERERSCGEFKMDYSLMIK